MFLVAALFALAALGTPAAAQPVSFTISTSLPAQPPVAVGDFNADSDPDLAFANANSNHVSIFLGAAGGSFTGPTNFTAGDRTGATAVGDFNGDYDPDLAVTNSGDPDLGGGGVSILLGGAGGSFTAPTSFAAGNIPVSVAVGDFNADSDSDLAVANNVSHDVSILLGAAGGSFTGPTHFAAGSAPSSVAVGDFNGDSDPDLAVTNEVSEDVSILLGAAGGSFTGPTNFAAGSRPLSVAVGDFNADSDSDLAIANEASEDVSILLGGAGGSFTGPTNFAAGSPNPLPRSVAVGDFNSDSDPDLAVVNSGDPVNLAILLGAAGGSFTGPISFDVSGAPVYLVALGDFNADSQPDLVVGSTIVLNTTVVNTQPDCSSVVATPSPLWPPNHKLRSISLSGATDPDGDTLTLTITGVTQDEPLNGLGDGDTSPDAKAGTQSNQVLLRAERSGTGDGRVYRVSFTGSDGAGGSCSGTVTVGVPKNMGPGLVPIDSAPPSFDSFGP